MSTNHDDDVGTLDQKVGMQQQTHGADSWVVGLQSDAMLDVAYERITVEEPTAMLNRTGLWRRRDEACSTWDGVQPCHKRRTVPSGMDS
jgi:hypothetical protein